MFAETKIAAFEAMRPDIEALTRSIVAGSRSYAGIGPSLRSPHLR
jgi:hypothetical protein